MTLSTKEQISLSFHMFARTQSPDHLDFLSAITRAFARVFPITNAESIKKSKRFYPYLGTHGFSDYQVVDSFSKCNPHTIKLNYEIVLRDLVVSIKMILDVFVRNLQFIIYHATENMKNKREKLGQLN
jgi:ribosomal protein S8